MKPLFLCCSLLVVALLGGTSMANEEPLTKAEERLAKLQDKYVFTGELKSCVSLHALRESRVIDDQTIFFRGPGKTAYLNKLPRTCTRLDVEERFAYQTSIGQLCHLDVITVVDSFGRSWNRCGLGKFEELQKKTVEDNPAPQG